MVITSNDLRRFVGGTVTITLRIKLEQGEEEEEPTWGETLESFNLVKSTLKLNFVAYNGDGVTIPSNVTKEPGKESIIHLKKITVLIITENSLTIRRVLRNETVIIELRTPKKA